MNVKVKQGTSEQLGNVSAWPKACSRKAHREVQGWLSLASDATQRMHALGRALRGFQADPATALDFLDVQPACLRKSAL